MKTSLSLIAMCVLFAFKGYTFTQNVTVQNHIFTPSSFTINIGDTVRWTWINGSHTTTSLTIPAGAATWNNSINTSNKTFIYVPTKTGTYNYKCTPHFAMGMTGIFTVVCPQASAQISAASPTVFCSGGSVLLNSSTTSSIISYQWKKNGTNIVGATASTFSATTTGSYTLMVSNSCGNSATSNAISVTANPLPSATITPSGTVNLCQGDTALLQANTGVSVTYQWKRNNINISGATSRTYKAKTAGNYRVVVTKTTTGCNRMSPVTQVVITSCFTSSITELHSNEIKVYPNPSSDDFNISIPPPGGNEYFLAIFDVKGTLVGSKRITSKDFSFGNNLNPGIYFIEVKKANLLIAKEKIIKK